MAPRTRFQKLAQNVGEYLKAGNATKVSAIILSLKTKNDVQKLELNYPHQCGMNHLERLDKYLLRHHIQTYLGKKNQQTVKKLILHLDKFNPPPKQPTPKEIADAVLNKARRTKAIHLAKLKGGERWHIKLADLAEWMLSDKNWVVLCDPKLINPRYRSERGATGIQAWTKFFRKPNSQELNSWETSGALLYLHEISVATASQITWFYRDLGFLISPSSVKLQGATSYLSGMKTKILNYRKAWHALANKTEKDGIIKNKIITTKDGPIKELWGPISNLTNLPGWKLST